MKLSPPARCSTPRYATDPDSSTTPPKPPHRSRMKSRTSFSTTTWRLTSSANVRISSTSASPSQCSSLMPMARKSFGSCARKLVTAASHRQTSRAASRGSISPNGENSPHSTTAKPSRCLTRRLRGPTSRHDSKLVTSAASSPWSAVCRRPTQPITRYRIMPLSSAASGTTSSSSSASYPINWPRNMTALNRSSISIYMKG